IIQSAVKVLQDPKVQSSSLGKKVAFLESKGLSSEEIEEAMARVNGTSTGSSSSNAVVPQPLTPQQQQYMVAQGPPPPLPPKYDWKDMFIAAVVAGGFSYGM